MKEQIEVGDYFNKEIEELIGSMSEEEMYRELTGLSFLRCWIAILKYNRIQFSLIQSALNGGDPIKDPTSMARNQGRRLGICDLQDLVISLHQKKEKEK
jgi:hypothetical protein